ncbi:MAG TPA: cupin domain-containing protein [Archaeoglobus veneficus]|nr:cupin domain-containing protein [Archaeoglobus veneficus]
MVVIVMAKLVKAKEELEKKSYDGIIYRIKSKSERLLVLKAELDVGAETNVYEHEGEEVRILLEGEIECIIGDEIYTMKEGDALWHPSNVPHKIKNVGNKKAVYITIGTPSTFI